jgi:transcriptional regulator with XRE-family HTH domain
VLKLYTIEITKIERDNSRISQEAQRMRAEGCHTLRSIAQHMGISSAYLSDLERDRRGWSKTLVEKFNRAIEAEPKSEPDENH